ncbi:sterile alpha motif domain-containing protein 9-like [Engraulis encrasicolus]|uniref:sterile alpha motif domain-containing protein 9-like n=1 Tax=Engraulis encrasicolus TaxID=184585 RepID=UPI002FD651BC
MAELKAEGDGAQRPADIKSWSTEHVRRWTLDLKIIDEESANILQQQKVNGESLLLLEKSDLIDAGIPLGHAKLIIHKRDELVKMKADLLNDPEVQAGGPCKPYPFNRFHEAYRYRINSCLDIPESGALDLIEPCHEFKSFINAAKRPQEEQMEKFTKEVKRFAAACMNSRTNGTIHFGVGDQQDGFKHGQILGFSVEDKESFGTALHYMIDGHFEHKHVDAAKKCIKPPRFVEVLQPDTTSSETYVVEVDIEPTFSVCAENLYHVYSVDKRKSRRSKGKDHKEDAKECKSFYIRDNSSTKDLLLPNTQFKPLEQYNRYTHNLENLAKQRKEAEAKHLAVVRNSVQGSQLCEMITGGSHSLDKSRFERYILVTNKSHPVQLDSLSFLQDMNLTAVLDFDPESSQKGLKNFFQDQNTNAHSPAQYRITEAVEDIASKLKLTRITSWIFCNGGINKEEPSDMSSWSTEKGASVRDVVSFLCRGEVLPPRRFLVIFLLLSDVTDSKDPLLETFNTFRQELRGLDQILCICENSRSFISWKQLIEARYGEDIEDRCISDLSFAEINGTVLSLWSANRRSSRFLTCGGGSKVLLTKKMEGCLDTLDILCVNQCEGGNEDKLSIQESFYKGGKVSWWNFYFSEEPGSTPFIKRDKFDYITGTIIPDLCSLTSPCVLFNIMHLPGCGGTSLAMHILWTQKDKFRCVVLKDRAADPDEVAKQVVQLLTYETAEPATRTPVLLMVDDFEERDAVYSLQQSIGKACPKTSAANSAQVIILNCMRTEFWDQYDMASNTVFIGNELSENEQKLFQKKLEEIEKIYKNADTFYGFMILKKNFSPEYIKGVAKNTLKSFNINHKEAQLIAVMVLLLFYCKNASLSVSLCEAFLGLQTKERPESSKVLDGFGKFSTLVTRYPVRDKVVFEAVKIIHRSMAEHCLEELTINHNISKAEITNLLLTTEKFYDCVQGKDKLLQDVRAMLVRRNHTTEAEDSRFSPLLQAIIKDTPGSEETVLYNAAKRFEKDAIVSQLLARYHCLKKRDFREAKDWARKAKDLDRDSSYIADTSAQVIKHELRNATESNSDDPIKPEQLRDYLHMAISASEAFKDTQVIAKKEVALRSQIRKDYSPYNCSGRHGEIQVAVMIIEILEKIPVFSLDKVRRAILSHFLSGQLTIQNIMQTDPMKHKHASYYHVLQNFESFLKNIKDNMRRQFDFLDSFFINLQPFFSQKDVREERTRKELLKSFHKYVDLFCKTDPHELMMNKNIPTVFKCRQFLEMNKADTHSGILEYLSANNPQPLENIVQRYMYLYTHNYANLRDAVNYIYASVVLACVWPQSKHILKYMELLQILSQVLSSQVPHADTLAVHFIASVVLWPENNPLFCDKLSQKLGTYLSQLKSTFSNEMQSMEHGKKPAVHFYLGQKPGYGRLVSHGHLSKNWSPEYFNNGQIWREESVRRNLQRVQGVVQRNFILADTCNPSVKVEVLPQYLTHLKGKEQKPVTFYIGFTMKGPVAFDIQEVIWHGGRCVSQRY